MAIRLAPDRRDSHGRWVGRLAPFGQSDPSVQHASEGFGLRARPPSFSVQHNGTPACFPAMATSLLHLGGLPETPYMPLRLQKERQTACAKSQKIGEVAT